MITLYWKRSVQINQCLILIDDLGTGFFTGTSWHEGLSMLNSQMVADAMYPYAYTNSDMMTMHRLCTM